LAVNVNFENVAVIIIHELHEPLPRGTSPSRGHVTAVTSSVVVVLVVVVVVLVADRDLLDPVDVVADAREDGRVPGAGARAARPADDALERPVRRVAAEARQRAAGVALAGALAAGRVPGAQHRRMHEVVVPRRLVAHVVRVVFHRDLVQPLQRTTVRCGHSKQIHVEMRACRYIHTYILIYIAPKS